MKDKDIRELQVSSSRLVVLFLSILILGLVIFLLGVNVGKKQTEIAYKTANASAAVKTQEGAAGAKTLPTEIAKEQTVTTPPKESVVNPQQPPSQEPVQAEEKPALKTQGAAAAEKPTLSEPKTKAKTNTDKTATKAAAVKETNAATPEKTEAKAAAAKLPSTGLYFVQVGAFNIKSQAQEMADQFKKDGYPALVLDPFPTDKAITYRVRIGGYPTKEEAEKVKAALKPQPKRKWNYFVVKG